MMESSEQFTDGAWVWHQALRLPCRIIDANYIWGDIFYRVWFPDGNQVENVGTQELAPLSEAKTSSMARLRYILSAAAIGNVLNQDVLLAPSTTSVVPLPHQLEALRRAMSGDRVRYLLADEVGLGKTIEAGLIMRELKLRGLAKRILIVAPKGLVKQWVREMSQHFNEEFHYLSPADFPQYRQILPTDNFWESNDQVICSLDSVKPLEARQGWDEAELKAFNKDRFNDIVAAGWDLIVVDEAHRIGGSSEQVARYLLGKGLSEASPYLLLLSATPHQGKSDGFHRLISLLDKNTFPSVQSVSRELVRPFVIRTEKRHAMDEKGAPLFKPRQTRLIGVEWGEHQDQRKLYEAVTHYVREGYNQALLEKKSYLGFLMILMQRLVTSSTAAIISTLEKRHVALLNDQRPVVPPSAEEEWHDLDGQEQLEALLKMRVESARNEAIEVEALLSLARKVQVAGPDAKAMALMEWIYRLQREEGDADLKVLIFTEFVPTQQMLTGFLSERGLEVVCLHGGMTMEQREVAMRRFAGSARVLVSTDAGGEGLNLQFCHVIINFDMPWNPMRIEQRIGRVDRIGQRFVVRALNFLFADSVEFRVREVLEGKLAVILQEFGVDKTADVLDSGQAGRVFDELYVETILHPEELARRVEAAAQTLRGEAAELKSKKDLLGSNEGLIAVDDAMQRSVRLWVEQMTLSYLDAFGGRYVRELGHCTITWPGERQAEAYSFESNKFGSSNREIEHLRLGHPKITELIENLPRFFPGMPVPQVKFNSDGSTFDGWWSLWEVKISAEGKISRQFMPLYQHVDGRLLAPSARHIFEGLCHDAFNIVGGVAHAETTAPLAALSAAAYELGQDQYISMRQKHQAQLSLHYDRRRHGFAAKRKMLQALGLPEVRQHRLAKLDSEIAQAELDYQRMSQVKPQLSLLLLMKIS